MWYEPGIGWHNTCWRDARKPSNLPIQPRSARVPSTPPPSTPIPLHLLLHPLRSSVPAPALSESDSHGGAQRHQHAQGRRGPLTHSLTPTPRSAHLFLHPKVGRTIYYYFIYFEFFCHISCRMSYLLARIQVIRTAVGPCALWERRRRKICLERSDIIGDFFLSFFFFPLWWKHCIPLKTRCLRVNATCERWWWRPRRRALHVKTDGKKHCIHLSHSDLHGTTL